MAHTRRTWMKTAAMGLGGLLTSERNLAAQQVNHACALADPRDEIKITGLEVIPVNSLRTIFVKMHTDPGITGIGEGTVEGRIPTGVDSRIAFALPFFKIEILAMVMPTFSASSVTLIFRLASITSILIMIAMRVWLYRQVVLGLQIYSALQRFFKYRRRGSYYERDEDQKQAHHDTAGNVILAAPNEEEVGLCSQQKTHKRHRAALDGSQCFQGTLREYVASSYVPQKFERLVECDEECNGCDVRVRQEWIVEIDLNQCGARISALQVRFPKHKSKSSDADEHNDHLKKYRGAFLHGNPIAALFPVLQVARYECLLVSLSRHQGVDRLVCTRRDRDAVADGLLSGGYLRTHAAL